MKELLMLMFLVVFEPALFAQNVRGVVKEMHSEIKLGFATIGLYKDTSLIQITQTDESGHYEFTKVQPGRYIIKTILTGYEVDIAKDVIVDNGKQTITDIFLREKINSLAELSVTSKSLHQVSNEMILTGANVFAVEEINRYAGSRGDIARMASCFAGIQNTDDSRNDLVIRGSSPVGLLWRIQDVDISNPNHFAIPGTTGGGISILNNKMFGNSDFLIGAFPAEYGNCNSGVFDIHFRNGNNRVYEATIQFGFLGTEFSMEGPISKKTSSTYLFAYRYSTLKLFESLNIKIGTDAVPNYQDLSFKINLPLKNGDALSFFGIGGLSKIDIVLSTFEEPTEEIYGENNKDQYFKSSMGVTGVNYLKNIKPGLFLKATLSHFISHASELDFDIYRNQNYKVDSLVHKLGYQFVNQKTSLSVQLHHKLSPRTFWKSGLRTDFLRNDLIDSIYREKHYRFENRIDTKNNTQLHQAFTQLKYKWSEKLESNVGIHFQYYSINEEITIEPRFSMLWNISPNHSISGGVGLQSQIQSNYIYFQKTKNSNGDAVLENNRLGFTKSFQSSIRYDYRIHENLNVKLETYYVQLYAIPIHANQHTSYSIINEGAEFGRFFPAKLSNEGTAYNTGFECTVFKSFSKGYYLLFAATLFESKYKGSDGILRNTVFNTKYGMNFLGGKEIAISKKKNRVLSMGLKCSYGGGHRYSPAEVQLSKEKGELIITDSLRNSLQFKNYFRLDLKIGYKMNFYKHTHELGFDLVNILNTRNILALVYAPDPRNPDDNPLKEQNQLGFLPLFYYKIDFSIRN
jgi:hypothetical protein